MAITVCVADGPVMLEVPSNSTSCETIPRLAECETLLEGTRQTPRDSTAAGYDLGEEQCHTTERFDRQETVRSGAAVMARNHTPMRQDITTTAHGGGVQESGSHTHKKLADESLEHIFVCFEHTLCCLCRTPKKTLPFFCARLTHVLRSRYHHHHVGRACRGAGEHKHMHRARH
jgi:hypothetical protein